MEAIAELQQRARSSGSFVDRAIVREIKFACKRFPKHGPAWSEMLGLVESWESGMLDLEALQAIRRINRIPPSWKTDSAASRN